MSANFAFFRTVVNGVGYRFALPLSQPPPPPQGDLVDIEVAVFFKDANKAIFEGHETDAPAKRRSPSLEFPTIDIALAGAIWHLPLFEQPRAGAEDELVRVQVKRMPPQTRLLRLAPSSTAAGNTSSISDSSTATTSRAPVMTGHGLDDVKLELNKAYDEHVYHTQYVDVLPKRDPPRSAAYQRLANATSWAVSTQLSTWFRLTTIDKVKRSLDMVALKSDGLPCTINGRRLSIAGEGFSATNLKMTCTSLADGEGRFLLVPITAGYACQPATASAEASYVLNNFQLIVEQEGQHHRVYEPSGKLVKASWRELLNTIAEYDSAERASRILYSEIFDWDGVESNVACFGVRLRDGGARLPLIQGHYIDAMLLRLPIDANFYAAYGTFADIDVEDMDDEVVVDVSLSPRSEPSDIILKVVDQPQGFYDRIFYTLRPRGDFSAVSDPEWLCLDASIIDAAAIRFIINAARASFGQDCLKPHPSQQRWRDSSPEDSPERKEKKPRLS